MFGLSRKTEYAVTALARLAEAPHPDARDAEHALSARYLAERDHLPPALLSGVMKQLQHAGLVRSKRGVRGGYYLALAPNAVRLADVIAAIEGPEPVRLTPCCEQDEPGHHHDEDGCPIMCRCPITGAVRRLNTGLVGFLQRLTLDDLLEPPEASEVSKQKSEISSQP